MLPDLPSQRNHVTGAAIDGRIHIVGGRLGNGLSPPKTDAHEVFDPETRRWTTAAPMLRGRSGINGIIARGCFHVWGGEDPSGRIPTTTTTIPAPTSGPAFQTCPSPFTGSSDRPSSTV